MNRASILLGATFLLAVIGPASGMDGRGNSSDHFTIATSLGTAAASESTNHSVRTYKAAHDDALAFVASAGAIHGAQLEQALREYRQEYPRSTLDDGELAQAIASQR
nr:DUF2388 domain-containing protein [uncultured Pseudomonas sp.]